MKTFLTTLFSGADGKTWAIGRVFALPTLLSGLGLPLGALIAGQPMPWAELGIYFASVCGGVSALIGLTNHTEPKVDP